MSTGAELIQWERARQESEEGWSNHHDDQHENGELIMAAQCYVEAALTKDDKTPAPKLWPWSLKWWKPSLDKQRNLVRAGALIAAEIDRLRRIPK